MITNERQYRITKAELARHKAALSELEPMVSAGQNDPVAKVHYAALASQVEEFNHLVREYEELLAEKPRVITVDEFAQLPLALIKARISLGLTQKDLAERLDVKEQQVQRWEASEYENISFSNLQNVVKALGVVVRKEIFVPNSQVTAASLVNRVKALGISSELFLRRIAPTASTDAFENGGTQDDAGAVFKAAALVSRIFSVPFRALMLDEEAEIGLQSLATARFKAPANANEASFNAYAVYAHYLALLTAQATSHLPRQKVSQSWKDVHAGVLSVSPMVDFKAVLHYAWSCGIAVLPLGDSGAFHGAVWRFGGRNVILLKQKKEYPAVWLYDLLHEIYHAGESPDAAEFAVIESAPIAMERRDSDEEERANDFAEDVILGNRSDEIEDACVKVAGHTIPGLKSAIVRTA